MAEFSAAIVLLIFGICIPLLDLGAIPVRFALWQQVLDSDIHKLAQSESFSSAIEAIDSGTLLIHMSNIPGVKLISSKCSLIISMLNPPNEVFVAEDPKSIKQEWLPNGARSPCSYEMEISSVIEISPLILFSNDKISVSGLTKPFLCTTRARAQWENYGRDPITKKFFLNE